VRRLITSITHDGLWHMNENIIMFIVAVNGGPKTEAMLQHYRLWHISFDSLSRMKLVLMSKVDRSKVFCNACELSKHIHSGYKMIGL
jgi:GAG-pre-integrase domain